MEMLSEETNFIMSSPNSTDSEQQWPSSAERLGMLQRFKSYDSSARVSLMRILQDTGNGQSAPRSQAAGPQRRRGSRPRILLMGQKRSGKSSITQVVFHKMQPSDTLYIETTIHLKKEEMNSFLDFNIWDFPGHIDFTEPVHDLETIFGDVGALVWVIDAQDEYYSAVAKLNALLHEVLTRFPYIHREVFVHKVDGLSDDYRIDTFRDIIQRVKDEASDAGFDDPHINFYMTSIYDHSIFDAFSKVCQRLLPQLPTLESLLNSLGSSCGIDKSFIFDVYSKIYIATDSAPNDIGDYSICSDFIDVMVDIHELYGWDRSEIEAERPEEVTELRDEMGAVALEESFMTRDKTGTGYLYLRGINQYLALVSIMKSETSARAKPMIDRNVGLFVDAVVQVLKR